MTPSTRPLWWLGVLTFFTLFAGEALRNTLSWYGFAAWDGAMLVTLVVVAIVRARRAGTRAAPLLGRRPPLPTLLVGGFVLWAALSLLWSNYRLSTLLALVILLVTTLAAVLLHRWIGWAGITTALTTALHIILGLSLLFELGVALLIGRPILPVFPIDVEPGMKIPQAFYWSRALLFEGGRIQGILGNANLLGFVALLALILTACLLVGRRMSPVTGIGGLALAALMLALTRSSTVIVAAAACVLVVAMMLLWRRGSHGHRGAFFAGGVVLVVLAGVAVAARGPLLALAGKSADLTGRLDIWNAVAGLIAERPILGWGWVSYWVPWVEPFSGLAVRNGVEYLQAHNAYLDVLFQLGPVGLVLFVGAIVATAVSIGRDGVLPDVARGNAAIVGAWEADERRAPAEDGEGMRMFVLARILPALLLTALVTQALAESRLLVEGNWAVLVALALASATERRRA